MKNLSLKDYKFVDSIKVLCNTQFDFRKSLGTTDVFVLLIHGLQTSLEKRVESQDVTIDFSSAFNSVNH